MKKTIERAPELSLVKQAFLAVENAEAKVQAMERALAEPIAIVGAGCRIPGGCNDPQSYWRLLRDGQDAVTEVPPDRWDVDQFYDPDPDVPLKMYTRSGAFLSGVDQFDPEFFGIAPREAASIDPQQRLVLEATWEALEHAGIAPDSLYGSPTGVFLGICNFDYTQRLYVGRVEVQAHLGTGNTASVAAGRLSYLMGLQGPCLAVDTACSSSLVAVHLACQSLRNKECDVALGCGVNLILGPITSIIFCKNRMLSPDGHCKTFDADADGYVRGEGVGVVLLKRLSDAVADGDRIMALIRGSAVNQDGPSGGLTVPNGPSQQAVIRQALAAGKVNPADVTYVEAHGTGTSLGDPIEVGALGAVFGPVRSKKEPLLLGSAKTNIGHLEGAAGMAGLIKVALMLEHDEIPPHLHFNTPNERIAWDELPVKVTTERQPWPEGRPRIAGVSSFGFSGTNAHVVLEAAPTPPVEATPRSSASAPTSQLLAFSAKSVDGLDQLVARYADHLAANEDLRLADVACTLGAGRSHFEERLAVVAGSTCEAAQRVADYREGANASGMTRGRVGKAAAKVAFLFTGQGAQHVGMGRELYQSQPAFRAALDECEEILHDDLDLPLLKLLYPPEGEQPPIDQTAYAQPALFAVEYALAQLWRSWGITPSAVMGHSVGEYVAACVVGVFSLEDGLKLIAERGRLMQALPRDGAMIAVMAEESRVADAVAPYREDVSIAAVNGPTQVTISGRREAIATLAEGFERAGIRTTELNVSHAFHSPLMEPTLDAFRRVAETVRYSPPRLALVSNVSGRRAAKEVASADYWCKHIRNPVRFAQGIAALAESGSRVFLEVGPRPILLNLAQRCLNEDATLAPNDLGWLASLRPGQSDRQVMLSSLGELYVRGADVEWSNVMEGERYHKIELPTYPFQRQRCWFELPPLTPAGPAGEATGHPLLGSRLQSAAEAIQFQAELRPEMPGFLQDHRLGGLPVLPASAYLEIAFAAAEQVLPCDAPQGIELREVSLDQLLPLPTGREQTVQSIVTPAEAGEFRFQFYRLDAAAENEKPVWRLHASATLAAAADTKDGPEHVDLSALKRRCSEGVDTEEFYQTIQKRGLNYGPQFRAIQRLWRHQDEVLAEVSLPSDLHDDATDYHLHPVLLDACIQALAAVSANTPSSPAYLPVGLERMRVFARLPERVWSHACLRETNPAGAEAVTADIQLIAADGTPLAAIDGLRLQQVKLDTDEFVRRWASELAGGGSSGASGGAGGAKVSEAGAEIAKRLKTAEGEERRPLMVAFLQEEATVVLRREEGKHPDPRRTFLELGMDSLMGLELVYRIRGGLGLELPAETLLYHATIDDLADELLKRLDGEMGESPAEATAGTTSVASFFQEPAKTPTTPWLMLPKPSADAELRLFCFHHLGGGASLYSGWSDDLPAEIELCPIQLPGREERASESPIADFPALIDTLVDVLLDYLDRPFAFFGHSAGNLISYELAQRVRQRLGLSPVHLLVGALWTPDTVSARTSGGQQTELVRMLELAEPPPLAGVDTAEAVAMTTAVTADIDLFAGYHYEERPPLDCPIFAFGGSEDELVSRDDLLGWKRYTQDRFRVEIVPGTHSSYLTNRRDLLRSIAEELLQSSAAGS